MLSYLKVSNFALIEKLEVNFDKGFNVITGETGTGKSIIIKALQLLLGERSNLDIIRKGSKEATIEASFVINQNIKTLLDSEHISFDDDTLVIKRVMSENSSKIFANGEIIPLQTLKKITPNIVNICGQHDNQILLDSEEQLKTIDIFSDIEKELSELKESFSKLKKIKNKISELTIDENDKQEQINYFEFQLQEINSLNPTESEFKSLIEKENFIKQSKEISSLCRLSNQVFYSDENSVLTSLDGLIKKIKSLSTKDESLSEALEKIELAIENLDEVASFFKDFIKKNNLDESSITRFYEKLELYKKMQKKHGGDISSLIAKKNHLISEINRLKNSSRELEILENDKKTELKNYNKISEIVSSKRKKTALDLNKKITEELQKLNMSGSEFLIDISSLSALTSKGKDSISFKIKTNKGEDFKLLDKIASGGELSRIMLAITRVISEKNDILFYVFDEIDAGIGGETGLLIGKTLKKMSGLKQTLVITHLPQVAVFGNNHFVINKKEQNSRVVSHLDILENENEKVKEIARMLGGNLAEDKALEHAQEMLLKSRS